MRIERGAGIALMVVAAACAPSRPTVVPKKLPEIGWVRSDKLDLDLQELVLRAYDDEAVFPIKLRLLAPLAQGEVDAFVSRGVAFEGEGSDVVALAQAKQLELLVANEKVVQASCATPDVPPPTDDTWRDRVDPDVRTVYAAGSSCWFEVRITFGPQASDASRSALEDLGARISTFDARGTVAFVPVRAIPTVASLAFVDQVDLASRPLPP